MTVDLNLLGEFDMIDDAIGLFYANLNKIKVKFKML